MSTADDASAVGTGAGPDPAGPTPSGRRIRRRAARPVDRLGRCCARLLAGWRPSSALFIAARPGRPLLVVIVAIVVMVMVHELGHFATAKWSHMKVTEYFVGFGPRLWSIRRGETEYGVKAIPAGGYVKIPGMTNLEEIDPADEPRTYRQQPFRQPDPRGRRPARSCTS